MRRLPIIALLFVCLSVAAAAPKKKKPVTAPAAGAPAVVAPASVPHPIAQFLRTMSKDGARSVTFKATAVGTRFYFEESRGVTVYRFHEGNYTKEAFLSGVKLATAIKRYEKR